MNRQIVTAMLLAWLCIPSFAARADDAPKDKPVAAVNTKTMEATVTIDPRLKAWPGLYESLLAEGKRELVRWRVQAEKDRKDMPDIFRDGRRYSFERAYSERSAVGRSVSIVRRDFLDALAAHPNTDVDAILWDTAAKKRVSVRHFFRETRDEGSTMRALARMIRAALVEEKKARDIPDVDKDPAIDNVKPKLLAIGAIALAPSTEQGKSSGLITYFAPYAVGSYVEGEYILFVPWTAFKDHLSPEGTALFGGARPAGDEKND
jgi:hypothetical protein